MDGNQQVVCKCLIQETCLALVYRPWILGHLLCPTVCHPWTLYFGIHAEKTDLPTLVYNDESSGLGMRSLKLQLQEGRKGGTMDGFRRMLLVGCHHSADHIPVSALHCIVSIKWVRF